MYLYRPEYRERKTGKPRKARKWWVEFYVGGRRFRQSTGTSDRRAAELVAAEAMKREELRAAEYVQLVASRLRSLLAR